MSRCSVPHLLCIEGIFVQEQPALLAGTDNRHKLLIMPGKEFKYDNKEQQQEQQEDRPDGQYLSGAGGELVLCLLLLAMGGVEILGRVIGREETPGLEVVQAVHVQGESVLGTARLALY